MGSFSLFRLWQDQTSISLRVQIAEASLRFSHIDELEVDRWLSSEKGAVGHGKALGLGRRGSRQIGRTAVSMHGAIFPTGISFASSHPPPAAGCDSPAFNFSRCGRFPLKTLGACSLCASSPRAEHCSNPTPSIAVPL